MRQKQYCDFDGDLSTPRQRSIRINGFSTCLRLEEIYWKIIEALADRESMTVGKLLSRWAVEMDLACDVIRNFTGYVRVVCVVQLVRQVSTMNAEDLAFLLGVVSARTDH